MKRFVIAAVLALAVVAGSQTAARANGTYGFGIGINIGFSVSFSGSSNGCYGGYCDPGYSMPYGYYPPSPYAGANPYGYPAYAPSYAPTYDQGYGYGYGYGY